MKKRNKTSPEFKKKVVLLVIREDLTINEIAKKYSVHPAMVSKWKKEFLDNAQIVFDRTWDQQVGFIGDRREKAIVNYEIPTLQESFAAITTHMVATGERLYQAGNRQKEYRDASHTRVNETIYKKRRY